MMYNLNIDNGVEVELEHDLKCMLHGSLVCFEFNSYEPIRAARGFILPNHYDELIPFLFDISRTKTILQAFRHTQVCKGAHYLSAYDFKLVDSKDGQTNITPEFVSAISGWKEVLS